MGSKDDILSNDFFFKAFCKTLAAAGIKVDSSAMGMFDFSQNQDFRGKRDDGRKVYRGGERYMIPFGWKRFAVNVRGRYDDRNEAWLGSDGKTSWAVAYHG